jgi:serine/threonine protein phosphatase PrpC
MAVYASSIGGRFNQQDCLHLEYNQGAEFYGVYDGHGENGAVAAGIAKREMADWFLAETFPSPHLRERMVRRVAQITELLRADPRFLCSGTTLCCALYYNHVFHVANVGDSKFEVADSDGGTLFETTEHKANPRIAGTLAVSRSLGDFACETDARFSALPDYYEFAAPAIKFAAILSTDGFTDIYETGVKQIAHKFLCQFPKYVPSIADWDSSTTLRNNVNVVKYLEVFAEAALCPNAAVAALHLADGFGSRDNTSAIVNSAFTGLNAQAPSFEPVFGFVDGGVLKATDEKGLVNGKEFPLYKTNKLTGFVKGYFTKGVVNNLEQVVFEGIVRCVKKEQGFLFVGNGKWEENVYCRPSKEQWPNMELNTTVRYTKFLTARTKQVRGQII